VLSFVLLRAEMRKKLAFAPHAAVPA